jgi:beta-1,4-mannosyltransferase
MRIAYLSPFTNTTNRYIDLQKQILQDCGFDVQPLSMKAVFKGQAMGIMNAQNLMLFHWLETRPFQWKGAHPSLSLKGLLEFLFYTLLMAVARAKVVYFVHDHAVHDTTGWKKRLSKGLIQLLKALADLRVVHDPSFCQAYRAHYLPHPLYWDIGDEGLKPSKALTPAAHAPFGLLGAVRPYKCIHEILEIWPADKDLLIRGRATPDYEAQLKAIIKRRDLSTCVDFQPGYLSNEDFNLCLDQIVALILPHQATSMLVSGAFFEGIGRVPLIVARRSPFMTWAQTKIQGIVLFDDVSEIAALVEEFMTSPPKGQDSDNNRRTAIQLFGQEACRIQYSHALL